MNASSANEQADLIFSMNHGTVKKCMIYDEEYHKKPLIALLCSKLCHTVPRVESTALILL